MGNIVASIMKEVYPFCRVFNDIVCKWKKEVKKSQVMKERRERGPNVTWDRVYRIMCVLDPIPS